MDAQQAVERIHQIERANRKRRIDTLQYGAARFSPEAEAMMNAREVWLEQELPDEIPWEEGEPPTEPMDVINGLLEIMRRYPTPYGDLLAGTVLAGLHIHGDGFSDIYTVKEDIRAELRFYSRRVAWAKAVQIAERTWQFSTERRRKENDRTIAHAQKVAIHMSALVRALRTCWLWGVPLRCCPFQNGGTPSHLVAIAAFEDRGDRVFLVLQNPGQPAEAQGEAPKTHLASEEQPFMLSKMRFGFRKYWVPMVDAAELDEATARVQRAAVALGGVVPWHVAGVVRMALVRALAETHVQLKDD